VKAKHAWPGHQRDRTCNARNLKFEAKQPSKPIGRRNNDYVEDRTYGPIKEL